VNLCKAYVIVRRKNWISTTINHFKFVSALPLDTSEWISSVPGNAQYVEEAGRVSFLLREVFFDPNSGDSTVKIAGNLLY